MARMSALASLTATITPLALALPHDLPAALAHRLEGSTRGARRWIGKLEALGWLQRGGSALDSRAGAARGLIGRRPARCLLSALKRTAPRCAKLAAEHERTQP